LLSLTLDQTTQLETNKKTDSKINNKTDEASNEQADWQAQCTSNIGSYHNTSAPDA
jgi:hypothetical protein